MSEKFLTPGEAANLKGVSRTTIYSAIATGRLPQVRLLGRLALREADVLAWQPFEARGRPPGIPISEETKARMSAAHKRRWKQRKGTP
ncbi:MAG: helix-turn-helix domain-containing protein [Abitibacteriaceae bacterium]|nr:helix-turn-helix domain-containing protein [Abditibacteriaceae bacterium]